MGGAVSISMLSVLGLMLLIGWKGLTYFWPAPLYQWQVDSKDLSLVADLTKPYQNKMYIGQLYERKYIPIEQVPQAHDLLSPSKFVDRANPTLKYQSCEQRACPADFVSILDVNLREPTTPSEWAVIEVVGGFWQTGRV